MDPIARRQIRVIKVNKERTIILTGFYFVDSLLIWFRFFFLLFSPLSLFIYFFLFFWTQAGCKSPWRRILLPLQRCANWWHIFVTQMFQNKNVPGPTIAKSSTKYDAMWHCWQCCPLKLLNINKRPPIGRLEQKNTQDFLLYWITK